MADRVVTGVREGNAHPRIVAVNDLQRRGLVDILLTEPGPAQTWFFVSDRVVDGQADKWPERWMRTGHHDGYGAALFYDEHPEPDNGEHIWLAHGRQPLVYPPTIYYDPQTPVIFPPRTVMPVSELRTVVLDWLDTGERPCSVEWTVINGLVWELTPEGDAVVWQPRRRRST